MSLLTVYKSLLKLFDLITQIYGRDQGSLSMKGPSARGEKSMLFFMSDTNRNTTRSLDRSLDLDNYPIK